jgi:hypothetical protein
MVRSADDCLLIASSSPWTDGEREAECFCQLIRDWQDAGTPIEEIERQVAAMSARDVETLEAVLAGLVAGQQAADEALAKAAEFRLMQALKRARPAGRA